MCNALQHCARARLVWLARCVLVILALLPAPVGGAPALEMNIVLVAEVHDLSGWLVLHQEVIATPPTSGKPLRLSLPGGTGGNRWLRVDEPKFAVQIITYDGSRAAKVSIFGKIVAAEAQNALIAFEHSALEVQLGTLANELTILYGLNGVIGQLLEIHLSRS